MRRLSALLVALATVVAVSFAACDDEEQPKPQPSVPPPDTEEVPDAGPNLDAGPGQYVADVLVERIRTAFSDEATVNARVALVDPGEVPEAFPATDTCSEVTEEPFANSQDSVDVGPIIIEINDQATDLVLASGAYVLSGEAFVEGSFLPGGAKVEVHAEGTDVVSAFDATIATGPQLFATLKINSADMSTDPTNPNQIPRSSFVVTWTPSGSGLVRMTLSGFDANTDDVLVRCTATDDGSFPVPSARISASRMTTFSGDPGAAVLFSIWRSAEATFSGPTLQRGSLKATMRRTHGVVLTP